jgi:hypothetical protein
VAVINLSQIAALQGRYHDAASLGRTALATALDHGDQLRAIWSSGAAACHSRRLSARRSPRVRG